MPTILIAICAYLFGSIPTGKIVGRYKHIDIQKKGSGNIGFANAVRVLGWRAGLIVLVGDVLKGVLPMLIAVHYLPAGSLQLMVVSFMPIIGHAFPVWLKFKGGKSIATGLGVILVIAPLAAAIGVGIYILTFLLFKTSALSSLLGAWLLPFMTIPIYPQYFTLFLLFAVFATYTHRNNIKLLVKTYAD